MSHLLRLICCALLIVPSVAEAQWSVQEDNGNLAVWVPSHRRSDENYTPTRYPVDPGPGQRPYAGWLYGEIQTSTASGGRWRALTTDLGVIGPPSLAGWVQNTFHELTGLGPHEPGWRHQLGTQPGI